MPESAAGKMIVGHFHDHFGRNWFPFAAAFRAPATRFAGRVASKSRRFFLSASNFLVKAGRSIALKADLNPTW